MSQKPIYLIFLSYHKNVNVLNSYTVNWVMRENIRSEKNFEEKSCLCHPSNSFFYFIRFIETIQTYITTLPHQLSVSHSSPKMLFTLIQFTFSYIFPHIHIQFFNPFYLYFILLMAQLEKQKFTFHTWLNFSVVSCIIMNF